MIKRIAHRGDSHTYPQNTQLSFRQAYLAGCDGIEFDVQLSKDKDMLVFHNCLLTSRKRLGSVRTVDLQSIDVGDGEQMPLFEEVLKRWGDKLILLIEVKFYEYQKNENYVGAVTEYLQRAILDSKLNVESFYILSFYLPFLKKLWSCQTNWRYVLNHDEKEKSLNFLRENSFLGACCQPISAMNEEYGARLHDQNIESYCYGVNQPYQWRKAINCGANLVMSDKASWIQAQKEGI